jgi:quercetin dioxygenase-like cupin family protein
MIATKGNDMSEKTDPLKQVSGELPAARSVKLTELVAYAPGSVVSRTLVKNAAGTITLFAFDAGQGLSEHSAPYAALVQVLDGAVTLTIGGVPVPAAAGETVLMPANVPHAVHASQRFKMLLTMIRG